MVTFYRDVLGLDDKPRPEIPGIAGHWHAVGDQELHLVGAPPRGTSIDSTGNHYCVAVDDLDETLSRLQEQGIEPEKPPYSIREGGNRLCFVRDPDGYRVELIERG